MRHVDASMNRLWSLVAALDCVMLGCVILVNTMPGAWAQSARPDSLEPYRHVYDLSPQLWDQCGDSVHGELYRQVVRQKVEGCPVPESDKAAFRAWAKTRAAEIANQTYQASPETIKRCSESAAEPLMAAVRQRLDAYSRGQISANGVIEEVCRPASP